MSWKITNDGFEITGTLRVPAEREGMETMIAGEWLDDLLRDRYATDGDTTKPLFLPNVKITVQRLEPIQEGTKPMGEAG